MVSRLRHSNALPVPVQLSEPMPFIKSGNVLGNITHLNNLKLLVVGGLICSIIECYGPLLCNVSGPRGRLVKHEDLGASPQMAKRLEDILRSKA